MLLPTINDIDTYNKVCLVRVDYNIPMDPKESIADDTRIRETLSTLRTLLGSGAKVVLLSHFGRPQKPSFQNSLVHISQHVADLLHKNTIPVISRDTQTTLQQKINTMKPSDIIFLENTRFDYREQADPDAFGKFLSTLGEVFVNEAFSVCHRNHGSVVGVAKYLPSVAGLNLAKEYKYMVDSAYKKQAKPYIVIIGGKKTQDKIPVLQKLVGKVDSILLTGGIANTFLKARGYAIGKSFYQESMLQIARKICEHALQSNTALLIPRDVLVAKKIGCKGTNKDIKEIGTNEIITDLGDKTVAHYTDIIIQAGAILRIGPVGMYEYRAYQNGTTAILEAIAKSRASCLTGGGDTLASIQDNPLKDNISHISTGGGATLHFIEKGRLVGIDAIIQSSHNK